VGAVRDFLRSARTFVARRRVPVIAGAVIVALVGSVGIWWGVTRVGENVDAVDCSTLEADDFGAASALAIACGEDVEVAGERTPWQTSWAGPSGTSTLEASAVPVRTRIDGEWVPIDPTLVVGDQSINVAAPVFPMSLNPGGAAGAGLPLGTIERDGHMFKIWFPLDLPVPVAEESRVVYEFAPGIRLIVTVNSDTTGFMPVIELADALAADRFTSLLEEARAELGDPAPGMRIEFATEVSEDLTLTVDGDSQMLVLDESNQVQFFAPPPTMWDSAGRSEGFGPQVTEVGPGDRLVSPSDGDTVALIPATLAGSRVTIVPDQGLLGSSETVWPVYIDPFISAWGAAERVAVRTGGFTSTLYNWTDISASLPGQGTGKCTDATCNTVFTQRLMWEFQGLSQMAALAGTDIKNAQFRVNGVHSYNCTAATTTLWRTSEISPSSTWANVGWLQQLGSRTESQRANCGTDGWKEFDATAAFVWAADNDSSVVGFGLMADESSMAGWKRFTGLWQRFGRALLSQRFCGLVVHAGLALEPRVRSRRFG